MPTSHYGCKKKLSQTGEEGAESPLTFFTGKFLLTCRENRGKEKKGKGENRKLKMEGESMKLSMKLRRGPLFSFSFSFLFFSFLFFFFHFLKPLKFVWGVPKWKISTGGKKHISSQEKSRKKWLCLLWKIFLSRHWTTPENYYQNTLLIKGWCQHKNLEI